jgi:hypothetical protein
LAKEVARLPHLTYSTTLTTRRGFLRDASAGALVLLLVSGGRVDGPERFAHR